MEAFARCGQPSHYGKDGSVVRLSIPIHANKPLKLGLLRHLMKQAGLDENDF
jgi:predicted RNA binding protein YcfA (HicA-like mRNA interferase family)